MTTQETILLRVAARTDVGLVREHNEDSFTVIDLERGVNDEVAKMCEVPLTRRGALLVVCDGMGGAAAGEVASAMAIETLAEKMLGGDELEAPETEDGKIAFARQLRGAAYTANERILDAAEHDQTKVGMGTTMTAVGLVGKRMVIAQVGDSRAYLLRAGNLVQVTRDQSLVNELLELGQITEEQAALFEHSNVILQALGVQKDVEVQLSALEMRRGDRLLLCSDGLTGVVTDEEIAAMMAVSDDLGECCRLLIDLARTGGGPDNITAIVARLDGEGIPEVGPEEPPVKYERWRLDEPEGADERTALQIAPYLKGGAQALAPSPPRLDFARIFFSTMVLFALTMGCVIVASALYRSTATESCTLFARPGLAVELDGHDVGVRTAVGGTVVRVPEGRHRVRLHGSVSTGAKELEVRAGARCYLRFESQP